MDTRAETATDAAASSPRNGCVSCERPTPDNTVMCNRCINILKLRLCDIPALVDDLETTISRQSRGGDIGGSHRKKGDAFPLLFNDAAAGKRSLIDVLAAWAEHIAGHATTNRFTELRPSTTAPGVRARTAVNTLLANTAWFRTHTDAGEAADAILSIRNQLRAATDRKPERLWAGPCRSKLAVTVEVTDGTVTISDKPSECSQQLYREWGAVQIICDGYIPPSLRKADTSTIPQGCGATHTIDARREFLLDSLTDTLLPLKLVWEAFYELLPDCNVPWDTARKWAKPVRNERRDAKGRLRIFTTPPRLLAHTITVGGVELFRGGDILDLARDETRRAGRRRTRRRSA